MQNLIIETINQPHKEEVEINAAQIVLKVVGVGGAGNNAIQFMNKDAYPNIDFIVANTDAQALANNNCQKKISLGSKENRGLGAGSVPEVGRKRAIESAREIEDHLKGADIVILTAGFGGGTGSGATPVIAQIAKNLGALTIAVVTTPSEYEGRKRNKVAIAELEALKSAVDSYIVVSNEKLEEIYGDFPIEDAYKVSNQNLKNIIIAIHDIIYRTGIINIDYADVRKILDNSGLTVVGLGSASGKDKAIRAVQKAFANNLYTYDVKGASRFLVNIQHDKKVTRKDISLAIKEVYKHLGVDEDDDNIEIISGHESLQEIEDIFKVSIVASGINTGLDTIASKPEAIDKVSTDTIETLQEIENFNNIQEEKTRRDIYSQQATTSEINNYAKFTETTEYNESENNNISTTKRNAMWFETD
ncbi:cell division protein FtsZ [Mycoplasma crocodyli]|uniref:Cell division protein FtsZ n=1 Tax=Mycoplasma crocodyli (strain ATCC 51981 / MP145) TaxID=512564 RepID=D5E5L6_MYCCM|nr:cell division protein FtsZ [Mycoplasma crocodyli]ADE19719.1 cell division protein FtsZ [Mycoplasma crocodyli MP145]